MKKEELNQLREKEFLTKIRKAAGNSKISTTLLAYKLRMNKENLEKKIKMLKEKGMVCYTYSWDMKLTFIRSEEQDGK